MREKANPFPQAGGDDVLRRRMVQKINSMGRGIRVIPVSLSREGLQA